MSSSAIASILDHLAQRSFSEEERKELYEAALRLAYSIETEQDTAQRLYHGVGAIFRGHLQTIS